MNQESVVGDNVDKVRKLLEESETGLNIVRILSINLTGNRLLQDCSIKLASSCARTACSQINLGNLLQDCR